MRELARAGVWFALALLGAGCDRSAKKQASSSGATSATASAGPVASAAATAADTVELPEVRIRPDADTTVRVTWTTPEGTGVNDEAPFRVRWNRSDGLADAPPDARLTGADVKKGFLVLVRPLPGTPNATLAGEIQIVVCDEATHSVCVPVKRSVELGFVVAKGAAAEATVAVPLPAAK